MALKTDKEYFVRDLWIASAVSLLTKTDPTLHLNSDNLVTFGFPPSENIRQAVELYYNGTHVSLEEYAAVVKKLRHEMYSLRGVIKK